MARIWSGLSVQEVRPSTYFRTESGDVTTVGAVNGIVAIVCQSNWGPMNKVVDISPEDVGSLEDFIGTKDTSAYKAIYQAFLGGAKMVRAVRVGSSGTFKNKTYGEKAYCYLRSSNMHKFTVKTTNGTTTYTDQGLANTVQITAKYRGLRKFTASTQKDLVTGYLKLTIYDGTRVIETFSVSRGEKESIRLVNKINSTSKYFVAKHLLKKYNKKEITSGGKSGGIVSSAEGTESTWLGAKIEDVASKAFKDNGSNPYVTNDSYSEGMNVLQRYKWNVIIPDISSLSLKPLFASYIKLCYETGQFGMTVMCGSTSGTQKKVDDRMAYATSLNDWRIVYILSGWVGNDGVVYGPALATARIAGMIAACETNASLTHIVVDGAFNPIENLTNGQMIQAEEAGCLVLSPNEDGQVWIDNAINTLVTLGNDQDEGWKKIRRTKCRFELMSRVNRTVDRLIGRLNNDANGRATIVGAMTEIIREMIAERKLFEGSYAAEDERYTPVGDRAYFKLVIGDIDSMEKIYLTYNFSYANPFSELDVAD